MVFESVLVDVLNKYLKPYVKKLDTSQLKIGVWKGNVSLGKLELKENLFDEFDLPLAIQCSHIGSIKMKIPWKSLGKDPIVVGIDELYVIVTPKLDQPFDQERDLKRKRKEKESQIQKVEEAAKRLKNKLKKKKHEEESDKPDTFTEKLAAHLVKNLQVKIRDVHIRYEDNQTNPFSTIAAGVTLSSLELKSTDSDWVPCVVKETATLIYKLVELNSLSLYWSTVEQCLYQLPGDSWIAALRERIARPALELPPVITYLLSPVSAVAKIKLNLKPGIVMNIPQLFAGLECDDISFSLSEDQFKSLMITLDAYSRHNLNQKYLKYKPVKPVLEDKRGWWLYAYKAVVEESVRRKLNLKSWAYMKNHRETCKLYTKRYHEKLTSLNPSSSLLSEIERLEDRLDVFNIIHCRKLAKRMKKKQLTSPPHVKQATPTQSLTTPTQLPATPKVASGTSSKGATPTTTPTSSLTPLSSKSKSKSSKGKEKGDKSGRGSGGFWSRFQKKAKQEVLTPSIPKPVEGGEAATSEETGTEISDEAAAKAKEEFYRTIGYSEDEGAPEYPREYIAHHIEVILKKVSFNLLGRQKKLATVSTTSVNAKVLNRPTSESVSVFASVGGVKLSGVSHDNQVTLMVTEGKDLKGSSLVNFELYVNPLEHPEKDLVVKASVQPLMIVYDEETVDGLIGAFRIRKNIHLMELTSAASSTFDQLKAQTSAGLTQALQNRKQLELDIQIHSPYILVPEGGTYKKGNCHVLVIDLGRLSLSGKTQDPKSLYKELAGRQTFSVFYDTFFVELSALQVLVAKPGTDWQTARSSISTPLHILDPTGFSVELKKSIVSDDALLPSLQVVGDISGFNVKLNDDKIRSLLSIMSSLKLPPPSLKNTTSYYNELPPPPTVSPGTYMSEDANNIARTVSVDTMSVLSFDDEDDTPTSSVGSVSSGKKEGGEGESDSTAQIVFTDVKINLTIRKISVSLSQLDGRGGESLLLSFAIHHTAAEVNDRNWDAQGKVYIKDIEILDYVNKGVDGKPTHLMKTNVLKDGNFLSVRFVSITAVGQEFAHQYSHLENTVSIQLSLIDISLHQATIAEMMRFVFSLRPAFDKASSAIDTDAAQYAEDDGTDNEKAVTQVTTATPAKEIRIESSFEGISLSIFNGKSQCLVHTAVTGFNVTADLKNDRQIIVASMKDVYLSYPLAMDERNSCIIQKVERKKNMIQMKVIVYKNERSQFHDLSLVDVSVESEIQRLQARLNIGFVSDILGFVKQLQIDSEQLITAYRATTETAQKTATVIKETKTTPTKPPVKLKLSVSLQAPHIMIPYTTSQGISGSLHIVLGDFTLSNRLVHGYDVIDTRASVVSLGTAQIVLDRMEIGCSSVSVYRERSGEGVANGMAIRYDILHSLSFVAVMTRNLFPGQTGLIPDVSVKLEITDEILFHVSDEDVQAFVTIALSAAALTDTISAATSKPRPQRSRTLTRARAPTTRGRMDTTPGARLHRLDPNQLIKLKVEMSLTQVSLELVKGDQTLIKGNSSNLTTFVKMTPHKVFIKAEVGDLGILDMQRLQSPKKVLFFSNLRQQNVVFINVEVPLQQQTTPTTAMPLANIKADVAQFQLYVFPSLVKRLLDFILSIDVNPQLVKSATKVAQDGAIVANELAREVFVELRLSVKAPNVIVSVDGRSGFMLNLGEFEVNNKLTEIGGVGGAVGGVSDCCAIDTFGITLKNFKLSRVLFDEGSLEVLVERELIQPYSMIVNLERNLTPWDTSQPSIGVTFHLGTFNVQLGQEDLETAIRLGISMAESIVPLIKKKISGELAGAVVQGLTETGPETQTPLICEDDQEKYKKAVLKISLAQFLLQLFKNEPKLEEKASGVQELPSNKGLASFELIGGEITTDIFSNSDIEVQASVKDLALIDLQVENQGRNTGNRVIQHYTSNPLNANASKTDHHILDIKYLCINKEHSVLLSVKEVLALSDINFIKTISDYFKSISDLIQPPNFDEIGDSSLSPVNERGGAIKEAGPKGGGVLSQLQSLPPLSVSAAFKNLRVALIENVDTANPQALVLKVSTYCQLKVNSENNIKQATLNVADFGITTCSFYDLETATSVVLLPVSILISMNGPLDNLMAMDVNGTVQTISLKLSPPIVRLIIHAIKTLTAVTDKPEVPPAPNDLWEKKPVPYSKLWYLFDVPLHNEPVNSSQVESSENHLQTLTLTLEGFELILETEATNLSPGVPVLSLNAQAVVQLFDWNTQLRVTGEASVEASYFNKSHSVWEPLLEPLELTNKRLQAWRINLEVTRSLAPPPTLSPVSSLASLSSDTPPPIPDPKFLIELKATDPLQLTITRTSIQLIKDLAEAYSKEYGKKVEGNVNVSLMTGAPFTITNKLGPKTSIIVKPGKSLKFPKPAESVSVDYNEFVDLMFKRDLGHISYASLVTPALKETANVDLVVDSTFMPLTSVPIDVPGSYYYQLIARQESLSPNASVVVEVAVSGTKNCVNVRSSVQVHNHLLMPIELLSVPIKGQAVSKVIETLDPGELYPLPLSGLLNDICVRPPLENHEAGQPHLSWQSIKGQTQFDLSCSTPSQPFNLRVLVEEERFMGQRGLQKEGVYPHHLFHIYPLAVIQNLMPSIVTIETEDGRFNPFTLNPGQSHELYYLDTAKPPKLVVTLPREEMIGTFQLPYPFPDEIDFLIGRDRSPITASILHEDSGYHRLSLYCPYWMINKTGLRLDYKDDKSGKVFSHTPEEDFILLSCDDKKNCKINLSSYTARGSKTDWSSSISLQAVGTSGHYQSKLANSTIVNHFGVAIQLSKFTLSKLVIITPYYLISNHALMDIRIHEERGAGEGTIVPKGQVVPFWPLTDSNRLYLTVGKECRSVMFCYKRSDSIVLKLTNKPTALIVDIQETDSSNIISVSTYYENCTPVQLINLLTDATILFRQDTKGGPSPTYSLVPGEAVHYTWDDPTDKRGIKWSIKSAKMDNKTIDISKDADEAFNFYLDENSAKEALSESLLPSLSPPTIEGSSSSSSFDTWLSVDDSKRLTESLVTMEMETGKRRGGSRRGYWKSFIDSLQRTVVFTDRSDTLDRIKAADNVLQNNAEISLSLKSIGVSLVDDKLRREVAYIGVTQSGVIWQVARKRGHWKTLTNTVIALLEEAYQSNSIDLHHKNLVANLEKMEMFSPLQGALRRTNYDGVTLRVGVSDRDYSLHAKIGFVQIDNQLPFSVYPQLLYPLPPPPTVASTTEPKPFLEASIILRKTEQNNINHFKYVHVLVQRMVLNVDLGFILSLVDFFSLSDAGMILESEYVVGDVEFTRKSLQDIVLPAASDEAVKRNFIDVLHLSPIKITLSFNVRSVSRNKTVQTVSDRLLQLLLHSLGVILTSVQEAQMNFSLFHLEYVVVNINTLKGLLIKHYSTQGLVQIHRLILGLDVLGNPVKIVRGVVEGTFDLFYEPIKGSVLGPEEFASGLGIGLKSFFGGTVGGLTGAGARITGAFGDIFAKLSFDDDFIDQRQQQKVKSSKLSSKVGGFFKNVAEGVTGVVVQPLKGVKEEGAVGLLKGTGRGLVGFLVRPAGGLIDLTSGTLEFVTRKTRVGNIDIVQLRPPRFIGRDGIIRPYSPDDAVGNALIVATDEGKFTDDEYYVGHIEISVKPPKLLVVTDRRFMVIAQRPLLEGWKAVQRLKFKYFQEKASFAHNHVYVKPKDAKYSKECQLSLASEKAAKDACDLVNKGYSRFNENCSL